MRNDEATLTQDNSRAELATRLASRFDAWCHEPLALHLLAVALLIAVVALRWWRFVFDPLPQNDETIYFRAFEAVARGASPYTPSGYLTFSFLAYVGGWGLEHLGRLPTLVLLRLTNLTGLAVCVWCSTAWVPWSWRRRLFTSAIFVALAPAVGFGIILGNLSLAMAGLLIAGLMFWPRIPVTSGAMLGLSIGLKPVAPGAIITLLSHRPSPRGRRHLIAAGIAVLVTGLIVLVPPHLADALSKDVWGRLGRSVSPHRFAYMLGLRGSVPLISAGIAVLGVVVARMRRLGPTQCLALAITVTVASTPLVWSHTLVATIPLQVLALLVLHHRWSESSRLEAAVVVLAVVAIQAAEGATNIYDQHLLVQWLGVIPPAFAPAGLTAYLFRHTAEF